MGHLAQVWDIPSCPGTLGWEGQWDLCTLLWDTWDMSGISEILPGLWDGKYSHSSMGHLGHVWDMPSSPGTLGWEGQRDLGTLAWDTWDMSGISQVVLGLWDGKDSRIWALYRGTLGTGLHVVPGLWDGKDRGIWALYDGTLGTCQGYPKWAGMGRTVGLRQWMDSKIGTVHGTHRICAG